MTFVPWRSPPFQPDATDPFIPPAELNFQYSAAQGKRPPARRLLGCLAGALSQCYMTYTAIPETPDRPHVHGPAVVCLCAHSTRMAHPQEVEGAAFADGESLPSARAYAGDSSWSGRFLHPPVLGSSFHLQGCLRSFCSAYSFPVCRTSKPGAWPQLGGPQRRG